LLRPLEDLSCSMADHASEGAEDAVPIPMYSIQSEIPADIVIPETVGTFIPYTVTTDTQINGAAEGLYDPVLIPNADDKHEGKSAVNAIAGPIGRRRPKPRDDKPGCCRRYSCCFPLFIVAIIWMIMFSSQSFEHCQSCTSDKVPYKCPDHDADEESERKADYYCRLSSAGTIELQRQCYDVDGAPTVTNLPFPKEFPYPMSTYFTESMWIALFAILTPCLCPLGVPLMMYKDVRRRKFSQNRQTLFDLLCSSCFLLATMACSWTIIQYYRYPELRCSTKATKEFGITTEMGASMFGENIWIMSPTTYSSFFAMVLLAVFSLCGGITVAIQAIIFCKRLQWKRRHRVAKVADAASVVPAAAADLEANA